MRELIESFDTHVIRRLHEVRIPLARFAIFTVYFWFGSLKILGISPAGPLVEALFNTTLVSVLPFEDFYVFFSLFEVLIGLLFLIRGFERTAIFLMCIHLGTTVLPLIFLPNIAWQSFLVPTLEGQYIIKNILIVACAVVIGAELIPLSHRRGTKLKKKRT